MRRYKHMIFVVRESVSSFTLSTLIPSENHQDLRNALLQLFSEVRYLGESGVTVRVDPAPGFTALINDPILKQHNIMLVIGRAKNINKNPIAEHAIEELGIELLHVAPDGGIASPSTLSIATANLNARIRKDGLSARDVWTQRDQITGEQLPLDDHKLIADQHASRLRNHDASSKSKAHGNSRAPTPKVSIGELVYLWSDRDKTRARSKYIITSVRDNMCKVRKFTQKQFRLKEYEVPLLDCYPIQPTTHSPIKGLICGMDCSSDSDSDPEDIADPPPPEPDTEEHAGLPSQVRDLLATPYQENVPLPPTIRPPSRAEKNMHIPTDLPLSPGPRVVHSRKPPA
jgi:hypothetical protein